jgi:hypothetical protein
MTVDLRPPGIGTAFRNFDYETEIDRLKRSTVAGGSGGGTGPQGPAGPAGTPGEKWYTGAGAPPGATGIVGDFYIDTSNGNYYEKTATTTWTIVGSLTGPQGPPGPTIDATTTTKGVVQLAGDLAGTAASPQIAAGVITDAEVATANKDGVFGTPSMRTLGNGSQQAMPGNRSLNDIGANNPATASVLLSGQKMVGLADPTNAQDAATKFYVDTVAQGLDAKASVRVATTASITLAGASATIDGVTVFSGNRVLVKSQSPPSDNGIYTVQAGPWPRATDADTWNELVSAFVFIEEGTVNKDTGWVCTVDQGGTLGTTTVLWTQFSSVAQLTDGAGLLKTGNVLDVQVDGSTVEIFNDRVGVKQGGITANELADGAVNLAGPDVSGTLQVINGGTGAASAPVARASLGAAGYYSSATHAAGTTITVTQNTHFCRASRGLMVQVQDEATGAIEMADTVVAANGDVTVTFAVAVAANSKRITVIG